MIKGERQTLAELIAGREIARMDLQLRDGDILSICQKIDRFQGRESVWSI